ncbi:MAG: DnaJ domain-containing protein [Pseudomonadota bacterium]|nr:DnaJ domain-containing protein [Pseudomonadota bacterium]
MGFLALGLVSLLALLLVASLAARLSARHLRLLFLITLFIILGTGLVVLALAGRYGLAAPIGFIMMWLLRLWRVTRESDIAGKAKRATGDKAGTQTMTVAEARDVLGVDAAASREEIETAYRDLIVKNHPDHGGTDWIAAQLNQARDILLNDH